MSLSPLSNASTPNMSPRVLRRRENLRPGLTS